MELPRWARVVGAAFGGLVGPLSPLVLPGVGGFRGTPERAASTASTQRRQSERTELVVVDVREAR